MIGKNIMNKMRTGRGRYGAPLGQDSADSREERVTKDTSGVMKLRDNMVSVGTSGGITQDPTVVGGCPRSEGSMNNGDEHKESTTANTGRSTAWEEMRMATVTTSGQMDTQGRSVSDGHANGRAGILSNGTRWKVRG